jgi:ABC-type nitrate/sulfonate/bicarbonate transport system substrate-binding protein
LSLAARAALGLVALLAAAGCSRPAAPIATAAMSQADAEREVSARVDVSRLYTNEFVDEADTPGPVHSGPPDQLRLGLLWLANDQTSPWFVGLDKGFFRDAGIDLRIVEGGPGRDNVPLLAGSQIELFAGNLEQGLEAVLNPTGADLVMICANFKESALSWAMLDRSIPQGQRSTRQVTAADLKGKRIGLQPGNEDLYVNIVCDHFGLTPSDLTVVTAGSTPDGLIGGAMDFYQCFSENQIRLFERRGYFNYMILPFRAIGYVSYTDVSVVRRDYLESHRDVLRRYVSALKRSFQYLIAHPQEAAEISSRMSTTPLTVPEVRWRIDRDIPLFLDEGKEPLLSLDPHTILAVTAQLYRYHLIELPPSRP